MQLFNFTEEEESVIDTPIVEEVVVEEIVVEEIATEESLLKKEFLTEKLIEITAIAEDELLLNQNFLNLYENEQFVNKMQKIKALSDDILVYTNISDDGLEYCAVAVYDNENYLCVDNAFSGNVYETDYCLTEVSCSDMLNEIVIINDTEEPINDAPVIEEPVIEEPVIEESLVIEGGSVTINGTVLYERFIGEDKYIVIDEKQLGPYSKMFFDYDETSYGVLCKYEGEWYMNIDGEVDKVSELSEDGIAVLEFYVLDGDYIYIFMQDDHYFVNDNGELIGPLEDYPNLFE
jgi:hypothetical protein